MIIPDCRPERNREIKPINMDKRAKRRPDTSPGNILDQYRQYRKHNKILLIRDIRSIYKIFFFYE